MADLKPRFDWLAEPRLNTILDALCAEGSAKFVGGCVRDGLLGQSPLETASIDIDIATDCTPTEMKALFGRAGIKAVATGESHGTITAVADGLVAECTTLRRDVNTDGRHAEVQFTRDWDEDWRRRDFTINALYADRRGDVWDPVGGMDDLAADRVQFIGSPAERIREDALRILRFFRFSARFAASFDEAGLAAIKQHTDLIDRLSRERIWSELSRTFFAERAGEAMKNAADAGVLQKILPGQPLTDDYARFREAGHVDVAASLAVLWPALDGKTIKARLRAPNDIAARYEAIQKARQAIAANMSAHELLYRFPAGIPYLAAQSAIASGKGVSSGMVDALEKWDAPQLPIRGQDLIDRGVKPGPEVSALLGRFERLWLDAGAPDAPRTVDSLLQTVLRGEAPG